MLKIKKILFLFVSIAFFVFSLSQFVYCQRKGMSFSEAAKNGNTLQHLDSIYLSGVHVDTTKAAFCRVLYDSVHLEYVTLLRNLGKYLSEKKFKWGNKTQCFNKIYFAGSGEIDYFLFNFTPGQIDSSKIRDFENHLNEFIKNYKFPLTTTKKFTLCSSVLYDD
jgi:hypothetical protein